MSADLQPLFVIFLGLVLLAVLAILPYAMHQLAKSVPPETAAKLAELVPAELVQTLLKQAEQRVLQSGIDAASQTPSELDDEFWKQIAAHRGATVTPLPNGGYTVTISTPPSVPTNTPK